MMEDNQGAESMRIFYAPSFKGKKNGKAG